MKKFIGTLFIIGLAIALRSQSFTHNDIPFLHVATASGTSCFAYYTNYADTTTNAGNPTYIFHRPTENGTNTAPYSLSLVSTNTVFAPLSFTVKTAGT